MTMSAGRCIPRAPAALLAVLLLCCWNAAGADSGALLTEEASECLECHEDESLEKDLTDGETISLNVDREVFAGSVHVAVACTGCHPDIVLEDHPGERAIESREAHRRKISTTCRSCHPDSRLREQPVHYALISRPETPACASCHDGHSIGAVEKWKAAMDETDFCLICHGKSIRTTLDSGDSLSLTMNLSQLRASVHLEHDCTDCHQEFGSGRHELHEFSDLRDHSLALSAVCRECHEEMYEQYEGSVHFSVIETGNRDAPVCTDCHGSHFVSPVATLETIAGAPCRRCHQEIFDSYAASMHGQARAGTGHLGAPICADCHRAHGVQAGSWTERLKAACLSCHRDLETAHGAWLPNAGLHLEAVACPSCHAPEAQRRIDLVLFDRTTRRPVRADDVRAYLGKRDAPGEGGNGEDLTAADLWQYLREANGKRQGGAVALAGQLEVRGGAEAHRLTGKEGAVKTCPSCHLKGSEAFGTVTMSLIERDGKVRHVRVDDSILGSVTSVGSLGGFYAVGSTRIGMLDLLLVLAVLGGMSVPAMHMTARLLARQRQGREGR